MDFELDPLAPSGLTRVKQTVNIETGSSSSSTPVGDTFWEVESGAYDALTNINNRKLFFDLGDDEITPYTIAGGISPNANFDADYGGGAFNVMGVSSHGSGGFLDLGSLLYFNRSRGTGNAPTALQAGDNIGGMLMGGYGSGDYNLAITGLLGVANDDWDVVPGSLDLFWMMNSTTIFSTDQTNLTTVYNPFKFNVGVAFNGTVSSDNWIKTNSPSTAVSYAEVLLAPSISTRTPLAIQGYNSQTSNLTEWQNDSGTVLSAVSASGVFKAPMGSASLPGLIFGTDLDTGVWSSAVNVLNFSTNGTERARFTSAGHFIPGTDSTYTLGNASAYWADAFSDRYYVNSTAYIDGGTAGILLVTGDLEIADSSDGIILESPDTTRWRVTVDNMGSLVTTEI